MEGIKGNYKWKKLWTDNGTTENIWHCGTRGSITIFSTQKIGEEPIGGNEEGPKYMYANKLLKNT